MSNITREHAISNKMKHQAQSYELIKHCRKNNIKKMGASYGAVVTVPVQVDSRDLSHPQGFIGVTADVKIKSGVLVICASGLLFLINAKKAYWILLLPKV